MRLDNAIHPLKYRENLRNKEHFVFKMAGCQVTLFGVCHVLSSMRNRNVFITKAPKTHIFITLIARQCDVHRGIISFPWRTKHIAVLSVYDLNRYLYNISMSCRVIKKELRKKIHAWIFLGFSPFEWVFFIVIPWSSHLESMFQALMQNFLAKQYCRASILRVNGDIWEEILKNRPKTVVYKL